MDLYTSSRRMATAFEPDGTPLFCADAVADPLTGLHAALATVASQSGGGGHLLDLALCHVAAHAMGDGPAEYARVVRDGDGFSVDANGVREPVRAPRTALPLGDVRPLGADTSAVLREHAC